MTNCKNCTYEISVNDDYCSQCGAMVIRDRITLKKLSTNFLDAFGWDNNYIITIWHLILSPQIVLKEYIGGTRKKYANPFALFTIILGLSVLISTFF